MVSECIRRVKLTYHGFTNVGRWNPSHLRSVPCEGGRSVLLAGPKAAVPKINMDELINAASRTRQTDPKNRHGMTCL